MRRFDPDLYAWWKREIDKQATHNRWVETAPITVPARTTRRGQILGLLAVFAVLALAGYAFYLDEAWAGAVLTALDVVAVAAVFAGGKKDD